MPSHPPGSRAFGIIDPLLYKDNKPLEMGAGNLTCPNIGAFWTQSVRNTKCSGAWPAGPINSWVCALLSTQHCVGFLTRQGKLNRSSLWSLSLWSCFYCQVFWAVLFPQLWSHQVASRIDPLACHLSCCRVCPQGLLENLASDLGLMREKQQTTQVLFLPEICQLLCLASSIFLKLSLEKSIY